MSTPQLLRTSLTDLVGVSHPVVQTGMGWVAGPRLVAATANAGALGILASATMTLDELEKAILEVQERTEDDVITVFMPTTPNPTTGFMMFVARKDTIELDMSVEEALKMVISLGVVVPQWNNPHPDRPLARFSGRP